MNTHHFSDISSIDSLQELTDSLAAALEVSICIRMPDGTHVTGDSRFGSFYHDVLEPSSAGSTIYDQFISELCVCCGAVPCIRYCHSVGLAAAAVKIRIEDAPIATIVVEDIRLKENSVSDDRYREIARSLQIDEKQYLAGIHGLPLITGIRLQHILNLLSLLAGKLCQLGRMNLNLKTAINSLEDQESLYQQERNALEARAERDSMTGLFNRRKFEEAAAAYALQKERTICMISADANFLKLTNDIFGHEAGDMLLQAIAKIMKDLSKSDWLVARCGGDEFRVILPDTKLETALDYCRRVARNCRHDKSLTLPLSVALGAAEWNSETETLQDCFSRADAKMYQNKTALKHELRIPDYILNRLYDRQILNKEVVTCTAEVTYRFARHLGFTKEHAKEISLAARYQDIGMAKLPESFVIRGQSRTEEETTQMHMHVTHGYTMARQFDELYKIADIILYSHESWNGKGYPGGLTGEHIPIEARILRITSDYVYRTHPTIRGGYYTAEEARQKMEADSGVLYDPKLSSLFLDYLAAAESAGDSTRE